MPTWANHFRIADRLLPQLKELNIEYFVIGNIAPDCGIPDTRLGVYIPPTGETHFTKDYYYSKKTDCDYRFVYETYIKNETDIKKKSFYIGYYAHLFADCFYARELFLPIEAAHGDFRENEELRKTVAAERNNIDSLYFSENISPSFEIFRSCKPWNEPYPEWYKKGEIAAQMKNIIRRYTECRPTDTEYVCLTPKIMSEFVDRAAELLTQDFINKGIII